jgi:hypothetical protein
MIDATAIHQQHEQAMATQVEQERQKVNGIIEQVARCGKWLNEALEHGSMGGEATHTLEDIAKGVIEGRFQLWPAEDAALLTEVLTYPQARHLHVFLAGGNLETIEKMRESVEQFGLQNGCTALSINGRPGWSKVFEEHGYQKGLTTTVKRLTMPEADKQEGAA